MNKNVMHYYNALRQAKAMLKKGIIEDLEFKKIEEKLSEKYCINSMSIYRYNNLIQSELRGNITPDEEV